MNALSALPSMAYPTLRAEPTRLAGELAAPRAIPFTELENLSPGLLPSPPPIGPAQESSFEKTIKGFVHEVSAKQAAAGEAVRDLVGGQNVSLHQTMIALEEAGVSFQLLVEVRNKLLESYQELMRMQV